MLERLPDGPVTLNHLGLPFPDVDRASWRTLMHAFARRPQSFVQLSGLPFLFGARWREAEARALLDEALDILGTQRLMFASDWPMLVRFATYADWARYVEDFVDAKQLSKAQQVSIFASNALRANPRVALANATALHGAPMKRSQINAAIDLAHQALREHGVRLPPYAYWSPDDWRSAGPDYERVIS